MRKVLDMHTKARWRVAMTRLAVAAALTGVVAFGSSASHAAKCEQAKLRAAGSKTAAELKCHLKAVKKGSPVDDLCLGAAANKFDSTFARAESRGGCSTPGDQGDVEAAVDACVSSILSALGAGSPPPPPAACLQAKMKASGKKAQTKFKCWGKAVARGDPVAPLCLTKAETKFAAAFAKAEVKGGCTQTGDAAAVEAAVDTCVDDLVGLLRPLTVCGGSETPSVAGITAAHNAVRASASPTPVPPLDPYCWSPSAAAIAQAWADTCTWAHNPASGLGENIYAVGYTGPTPPVDVHLDAVDTWASEAANYDYAANTCSGVCGHYTQIVWRATQSVGCGIRNCTTGSPFGPSFPNWTIVVCNYDPPGNWVGQRPY